MQAGKDVQKTIGMMEEVGLELGRKKEASHKAKALKAEVGSHEAEAAQLTAQHQHLQRQLASLTDRLQRLEHQAGLFATAASSVHSCYCCPHFFHFTYNLLLLLQRTLKKLIAGQLHL